MFGKGYETFGKSDGYICILHCAQYMLVLFTNHIKTLLTRHFSVRWNMPIYASVIAPVPANLPHITYESHNGVRHIIHIKHTTDCQSLISDIHGGNEVWSGILINASSKLKPNYVHWHCDYQTTFNIAISNMFWPIWAVTKEFSTSGSINGLHTQFYESSVYINTDFKFKEYNIQIKTPCSCLSQ
jgi:hypothetical protein